MIYQLDKLNKNKKAQEEIVGFAVIVIIVAVIMLFLLVFYLRSPQKESVESYEVNSFIQSFLHYTTDCEDYSGGMDVQELIFECNSNELCVNDERNSCDVLNSTLKDMAKKSWSTGADRPVKGYELKIMSNSEELISLKEGNVTGNYKGAVQPFARRGESLNISFRVYY